jgi:hypothetical protein
MIPAMTKSSKSRAFALLCLFATGAQAQTMGGNASLAVTTTTASVALPASVATYPCLLIMPALGATAEVFYALGGPSVAANTSSAAVPSNGICLNAGPSTFLAAITASGAATLRLTQLTVCPPP